MSDTVKLLCIGVANSEIAGKCPGADLDASRMYALINGISTLSYGKLLQGEYATYENVIQEMRNIILDNDGLAIVFYAGHGGSKMLKADAPEEIDGNDEFLALYDKILVDDDIWNIVSTATCRVLLIFDCCHSETMFRLSDDVLNAASKNTFKKAWKTVKKAVKKFFSLKEKKQAKLLREAYYLNQHPSFSELLCWSGCADDKTSVGSWSGGAFTNVILNLAEKNKTLTYDAFWKKVESYGPLRSREIVKQTLLRGESFNEEDPGQITFGKSPVFR